MKAWAVSAIIGISIFSLFFVGWEKNDDLLPSSESNAFFSEQEIIPKISTATEKKYSVEPKTIHVLPENNEPISTSLNGYFVLPFYQAFAVTSVQNTITITQWQVTSGTIQAFDSQGNFFTRDSNKIGRGDISTDTHTQWVLPNNNSFDGATIDVDSSGFVYFSHHDPSGINFFISKFDHNTDTFTTWLLPTGVRADFIVIDSTDNVYMFQRDQPFLSRLEPSTNTITSWTGGAFNNVGDVVVDSAGDIYIADTGLRTIVQFEPSTNTVTTWPTLSNSNLPYFVTVDSSGNIFFTETVPFNTFAIARLDPNAQMIKEWLIPELTSSSAPGRIAVDSTGNIFFGQGFNRLVPSTNTVTTWNSPSSGNFFEVNSADIIIWADGVRGGTIT